MILGVTGTRTFITEEQFKALESKILEADEIHHGACTEADASAHMIANVLLKLIFVHPPTNTKHMMIPDWNHPNIVVLPHKPYNVRNKDIVDSCDELIALPNTYRRPHSGTWNTVGFAEKAGKPVTICYPDGRIEHL